jgi:hypothetical protein
MKTPEKALTEWMQDRISFDFESETEPTNYTNSYPRDQIKEVMRMAKADILPALRRVRQDGRDVVFEGQVVVVSYKDWYEFFSEKRFIRYESMGEVREDLWRKIRVKEIVPLEWDVYGKDKKPAEVVEYDEQGKRVTG